MNFKVNVYTAIIVLIVGLYDLAYAFNRRQNHSRGNKAFMILGLIFTVAGVALLFMHWMN
ncbi:MULTISPECIES: DUF308 domain-containing protein [unclassified Lactobacillus]|uniref:DUF308 domain-containing protein n=1 Tax=unclassified Lactobacillus TaxID=2620435 RepID=UPI000EFC3423|nr:MULTISPECIES: DUF308 domain-containing protein [unclassified Lactobacillus]RMC23979.1 hypothetical protein F5ESL0247_06200 [Lactobacillus sp. ESL0247]RMC28350.1 hypothetical protein F5ESL0246_06200 [Lactobacillus sp. ESL0246]RMC31076.1 hypothetical protein F5ESL0245_06205 [Lactobacillus sp. ESL0245]